MRKLTGAAFVSLDGVMQAPGGPSEDWTQGFPFGGWMFPLGDESVDQAIGGLFDQPFDLLLGRKTYEIFAAYWPYADPDFPITKAFNQTTKHVLTHSDAPLDWEHSHRVATIEGVAEVKASAGPDLVIQGSSTLYPQLLAAGLIDRLIVMTFPVILGQGKRLFGAGTPPRTLTLTDHKLGSKGVMVASYEPAGEVVTGSFGSQEPSEREKARQARMQREG
ncbi:dihydrofolate reductase family protein [Sphingomonas sp. KR3-1]|uniref:dihydrofolate reductase family protein n=1 Tax=Sphingomonas sp. KR3-1 TaxID=3156611 RepID=UPI0032B42F5B